MTRRKGILVAVALVAIVGGAGYLGARNAQGQSTSAPAEPTTVSVTRGDVETTVTAPGHLVNVRETTLAFTVGGTVTEVYVQAGQRIAAGEVVAQLDAKPLEVSVEAAQANLEVAQMRLEQLLASPSAAELAAAELSLASAEAKLNQLKAGPSAVELAVAKAEVAAARMELEKLNALPDQRAVAQAQALLEKATAALQQAQAAYDLVKGRPDVGMLPQSLALQQATIDWKLAQASYEATRRPATPAELEAAQSRLSATEARLIQLQSTPSADELVIAQRQVEVAEAQLAQLTQGASSAEVRQAEASLRLAELAYSQALTALEEATMTAPFDGIVLEVSVQRGEMVPAGSGLFLLADPTVLEVEVTVIEEDLPLVDVGQRAVVFFDAEPETEFGATVTRIVPQRLPGDRPLYFAYLTVDDVSESLVSGMTADSSIIVDSRCDVLRLPRALVRTRSDGTGTVQVWTGTDAVEREVQTGLRGDAFIEILDGLSESDRVVAQ